MPERGAEHRAVRHHRARRDGGGGDTPGRCSSRTTARVDGSAALAERAGARVDPRTGARLRQRLPGRVRRSARPVHPDGGRRPDVRLQRDPPVPRRARGGGGHGDRRPDAEHPPGRDAVAPPLHRQPAALAPAEPALPHRRERRALRDARVSPRAPGAPGTAHQRHGVRLRDGRPSGEGGLGHQAAADRVPPARRGVEALELPRRLAAPALPGPALPQAPLHHPRRGAGGARRPDLARRCSRTSPCSAAAGKCTR